jgi:predicted flap endonuclease-1-like 5' DNA nuclease
VEEKMFSKGEPKSPQNVIELEELKGIGAKTAGKLKAVNSMTVSDLAKALANALSQKTGISEKVLSKWIEQANVYKRTEH